MRQDKSDGFCKVSIISRHSVNTRRIELNKLFIQSLHFYSVDLIGIKDIFNNKKFKLLSIYIPPSSNPSSEILDSIFAFPSRSSITGCDFNSIIQPRASLHLIFEVILYTLRYQRMGSTCSILALQQESIVLHTPLILLIFP